MPKQELMNEKISCWEEGCDNPPIEKCTSKILDGNVCVRYGCVFHTCMCTNGVREML